MSALARKAARKLRDRLDRRAAHDRRKQIRFDKRQAQAADLGAWELRRQQRQREE